jgi:hypothetical protein
MIVHRILYIFFIDDIVARSTKPTLYKRSSSVVTLQTRLHATFTPRNTEAEGHGDDDGYVGAVPARIQL